MKSLILQAQRGDLDAIVQLADELRVRVRSIAARYCRTTGEEFDDLLQEAWLGLLAAVPEARMDVGDPAEYLLKRARWRVLDYVKWQRRRKCESLETATATDATQSPARLALSSATMAELFSRLSTTQRRVLLLLLNGLTWREAAKHLGCASSNVAYHVRVIRKAYADLVADGEEGEAWDLVGAL